MNKVTQKVGIERLLTPVLALVSQSSTCTFMYWLDARCIGPQDSRLRNLEEDPIMFSSSVLSASYCSPSLFVLPIHSDFEEFRAAAHQDGEPLKQG
jgi:hypothetical protein